MKKRAFTLIEAIVVVALLAIIAAILFPVFARHRENDAHPPHSGCVINLKQIALGFKQYVQDNDERYPLIFVTSGASNGVPPYGWADALQPYIKNTQVYQCVIDTNEGSKNPTTTGYTDYWYNANFVVRNRRGKPAGASEKMLGSPA